MAYRNLIGLLNRVHVVARRVFAPVTWTSAAAPGVHVDGGDAAAAVTAAPDAASNGPAAARPDAPANGHRGCDASASTAATAATAPDWDRVPESSHRPSRWPMARRKRRRRRRPPHRGTCRTDWQRSTARPSCSGPWRLCVCGRAKR